MNSFSFNEPSYELDLDRIHQIDVFRVTDDCMMSVVDWPERFSIKETESVRIWGGVAQKLVLLFSELTVDEPDRCHTPPWGISFYDSKGLCYSSTICFECSNVYVYSEEGANLRAFDTSCNAAKELFQQLSELLPIVQSQ